MEYGLITFKSTYEAIKAKSSFKESILDSVTTIVNIPSQIQAGCGMAIRFEYPMMEQVKKFLNENNITIQNIYRVSGTRIEKNYELLV